MESCKTGQRTREVRGVSGPDDSTLTAPERQGERSPLMAIPRGRAGVPAPLRGPLCAAGLFAIGDPLLS